MIAGAPAPDGHLTSRDGLKLHYRERVVGAASPHVVLVHGVAEHGGRYRRLDEFLAERGVGLSVADLRGHGLSDGRRVWVPSFESYLDDLDVVLDHVQGRSDRLFLIGHSLGGLIAVRYAETRRVRLQGLVTSGAALKPTIAPPAPAVWALRQLNRLSSAIPVPGLVKADQLSRDPAVVQQYEADPLVPGHLTTGLGLASLEAGRVALAEADRIETPTLLLHGGQDSVVAPSGSAELFSRLRVGDKRLEIFPGLYHEIFNEPERTKVLTDLVAWVQDRSGA